MGSLWQDFRFSVRSLLHNPTVTVVAIVSLALGIGANSTVFSLANSLLLKPLAVHEPDRLVSLFTAHKNTPYGGSSYPDYCDLRDRVDVLDGVASHFFFPMSLKGPEKAETVMGQLVSWDFFSVLGVPPALGRAFLPEEDVAPQGRAAAVLSDRLWRDRFGADPDILGSKVIINSYPFEVVGVMPKGFRGVNVALSPDVWVPVTTVKQTLPYPISLEDRSDSWLRMIGRLKPGVTVAQTNEALEAFATGVAREHPSGSGGRKRFQAIEAERNRIDLSSDTDEYRRVQTALFGIVGAVLLIACFNVASLLLARATERSQEFSLRLALGASRWRIIRQLFTESLLLALTAGGAGLLAAQWALDALMSAIPPNPFFTLDLDVQPDSRVFAFTLLVSLAAGLISGVAPALRLFRKAPYETLRDQGRSLTRGVGRTRIQDVLVASQVALSLMLLIGSALFLRSLRNTIVLDPGFATHNITVAEINLGFGQYDEVRGRAFYDSVVERVSALPEVRSAALVLHIPLGQLHSSTHLEVEGYEPAPNERMSIRRNAVSAGFFKTLEVEVVRGRPIGRQDTKDSRPVAVVNQAFVDRYLRGQNPIGRALKVHDRRREIVGVTRTGKYDSLDEAPQPYLWLPLNQLDFLQRVSLIVKVNAQTPEVNEAIVAEVRKLDPNLPEPRIVTMEQNVRDSVEDTAGPADLVGAFGLLAVMLALAGVYGLMSYSVGRRTQEFGVRLALGADNRQILSLVLRKCLVITLGGLAAGLAGSFAIAKAVAGMLFQVNPLDPLVFLGVPLALAICALAASVLPARLASRTDPAQALRYE